MRGLLGFHTDIWGWGRGFGRSGSMVPQMFRKQCVCEWGAISSWILRLNHILELSQQKVFVSANVI